MIPEWHKIVTIVVTIWKGGEGIGGNQSRF